MDGPKQNVPEFSLWLFLESIEWRDPWLIGLVTFHVIITLMAILTRNHGNFQVVLFLMLLLLVYFSENINEVASTHWRTFSRQQYFDNKGLFISLVFSVPILLNCMIMVSGWLYQSSQLMTQLRQAQLRQNQRRQTPPYDSSSQGSCPQRLKSD
ncbi:transmembrane protein 18 isoform X2 [Homalodisca vitripennis]|nr:transmembrane protein 18 isoform X2 [Homalodisca vitripennis]